LPYIILDDVRSLNQEVGEDQSGTQSCQTTLPNSPKDDRVRVELVLGDISLPPSPTKPDPPVCQPARTSRKRKRPSRVVEEVEEAGDDSGKENDGWRMVDGGKSKVRRVGNCLIHKPIKETPSQRISLEEQGVTQSSDQPPEIRSTLERDSLLLAIQEPALREAVQYCQPTCDGPGVALILHKLVDALSEMPSLEDFPGAKSCCCDTCRPKALRAFRVVTNVLLPCAEDLEKITHHHYKGNSIFPSQISDISPHKHGQGNKQLPLFVEDSSDEG